MRDTLPLTTVTLGRYHLIAWTVFDRNPDGEEMVAAFIPVGDAEYPDGLMLVGGSDGVRTGAATREASVEIGRARLAAALEERGLAA